MNRPAKFYCDALSLIVVARIIVDDCRKLTQSMILPLSMIFIYHFNIQSMALTRLTTL